MQDSILLAKIESAKRKKVAINMPVAQVAQVCSATNVWLKYHWLLNYLDNKAAINLGLPGIEKY